MSKTPEGLISRQIQDWLRDAGYFALRLQSGIVKVRGAFMHLCPNGTPDLCVFDRNGLVCWIEVKTKTGKQREAQIEFEARAKECGHTYLLARSLEDVIAVLQSVEK